MVLMLVLLLLTFIFITVTSDLLTTRLEAAKYKILQETNSTTTTTTATNLIISGSHEVGRGWRIPIQEYQSFHDFYPTEQIQVTKRIQHRQQNRLDGILQPTAEVKVNYNLHLATVTETATLVKQPLQQYESKKKKKKMDTTSQKPTDYGQWCRIVTPSNNNIPTTDVTKATVLITGVFSHPLGVHIAKVLQTECSSTVSKIFGIDSILPKCKSSSPRVIRVIEERMKLLYTPQNNTATAKFVFLPIPFIGLAPRILPLDTTEDDDWDLIRKYKPTHIVHLMPYTETYPILKPLQTEKEDMPSPYFQLHQRRTSMEQILTSIYRAHQREGATIPHLVYASSSMEDLLVHSYATILNLTSPMVGLRFSSIYGPTGSFGMEDIPTMATNAVLGPKIPIILPPTNSYILFESDDRTIRSSSIDIIHSWWDELLLRQPKEDWIHVEDATRSVLAAMQFSPSSPSKFHAATGTRISLISIALLMEQHLPRRQKEYSLYHYIKRKVKHTKTDTLMSQLGEEVKDEDVLLQLQYTKQYLRWEPQISIQDGITQMLHWYFYQWHRHGPTMQEVSTDALPSPLSIQPWVPYPRVPCSSECALSNFCDKTDTNSVWSTKVLELSQTITKGYEVVFYVVNLNESIIKEYMADSLASSYAEEESLVCKVAFVQKQSDLVQRYLRKYHTEQQYENDRVGSFMHGEFLIVWVEIESSISPADLYYAKIAPRSLFAETVIYALYADFYAESYPSTNEILFLVGRMAEGAQGQRTKNIGQAPRQKRFFIPARPSRRAVMLVQTPVVYDNMEEIKVDPQVMKQLHHVMLDLDVTQDTPQRKAQGKFYDLVHHLMEMEEFRDLSEWDPSEELVSPLYSAYVIHDLLLEEGRQLRCDWYKEHIFWNGSELDGRSLSYVLYQRAWAERHGVSWKNDDHLPLWLADLGWIPILQPLYNLTEVRYHYPYAIPSQSVTGSRMYYNQIVDHHGDGLYVRLTREILPKSLTEELFKAAHSLEQLKRHTSTSEDEMISNTSS